MISRIRALIFRNWLAKLVCLLIAIGIWLWVVQQQSAKESFDVEIEYVNRPENVIVTNESERFVTVVLRGQRSILNNLRPSDLKVEMDLKSQLNRSGSTPGEKWIWIQPRDIRHPEGLEVESIKPRSVHLVLEQKLEKVVPVRPTVVDNPPDGYEYNVETNPDTARVAGPHYVVRSIQHLSLERMSLQGKTSSFTKEGVPAILRDEDVWLEYPETNQFSVRVEIKERQIVQTFSGIPVQVRNVPPGKKATVEPSTLNLTVRGPERQVKRLSTEDFTVQVRIDEPEKRQKIYVPEIILPEGVQRVQQTGSDTTPQGGGVDETIKQVLVTLEEE